MKAGVALALIRQSCSQRRSCELRNFVERFLGLLWKRLFVADHLDCAEKSFPHHQRHIDERSYGAPDIEVRVFFAREIACAKFSKLLAVRYCAERPRVEFHAAGDGDLAGGGFRRPGWVLLVLDD